ncbi:AMP-binding protein [Massilia sp. Se16.2.3]|uniref:AMP-binding protein n=1 Tax=Massilia sp. Se16.2.3 TaxID=2709303 RepID=UPI0022770ED9|nr:AMP-binding protein [Massilia sp. Se16.2.3]
MNDLTMADLIHDFLFDSARRTPAAEALVHGAQRLDYAALAGAVMQAAGALVDAGVQPRARALPCSPKKRVENVAAMFGAAAAGAVFVPVNPQLKPEQVAHILADCNVRVLLTSPERLAQLGAALDACPDLRSVFVTGGADINGARAGKRPSAR